MSETRERRRLREPEGVLRRVHDGDPRGSRPRHVARRASSSRTFEASRSQRLGRHGQLQASPATFLPTGNDTRVVVDQVTDPVSDPGDCVEPVTSITVSHQAPPGPPPPPPCKVPSFVNTSSGAATGTWTALASERRTSTSAKSGNPTRSCRRTWSAEHTCRAQRHHRQHQGAEYAMNDNRRGQALVEMAIVLPVLLIILLGIFDFGRAIYAFNTISNSAREAARLAIVDQNTAAVVGEGQGGRARPCPRTNDRRHVSGALVQQDRLRRRRHRRVRLVRNHSHHRQPGRVNRPELHDQHADRACLCFALNHSETT